MLFSNRTLNIHYEVEGYGLSGHILFVCNEILWFIRKLHEVVALLVILNNFKILEKFNIFMPAAGRGSYIIEFG